MAQPLADPAAARALMVDGQVRPNKVTNRRILEAMRRLPRERFLPPGLVALAYADQDVPLADGRVLIKPMLIARLAQLLDPRPGERVLVVGAGTGYGAALLAACGAAVTALEEVAALRAIAAPVLAEAAPGVSLVAGPLVGGWAGAAPYDAVLIEGAVTEVPAAVAAQLRPGGRIVTVLAGASPVGAAAVGKAVAAGVMPRLRPAFDAATALLPSLRPAPAFVF